MFDPGTGTATCPDTSQCVLGDATWIRATTGHRHFRSRQLPARSHGKHVGVPGRELVVLMCLSSNGERIVLDAAFMPEDRADSRNDADQAVDMLTHLLDEHGDLLRQGLRGFIYDMAMSAEAIDRVLDIGVLPITKVPRSHGGGPRSACLGPHTFTANDGTRHDHDVIAIDGSPVVLFANSHGVKMAVPLHRHHFRWERGQRRHIAVCRFVMPSSPIVPKQLRGAVTAVRLNSTDKEVHAMPHMRRTRALRVIPEADPGFEVYSAREVVESEFAHLKHRAGHGLRARSRDTAEFSLLAYLMLQLAETLDAFRNRS